MLNRRFVLTCLVACFLIGASGPATAQPVSVDPIQIVEEANGVRIIWSERATEQKSAASALWPQVAFGALRVPARLVTLRLPDGATPRIQLANVASTPWRGTLASLQDTRAEATASIAGPLDAASLPGAPVVVLREGRLRGTHLVVVAVSSLFAQRGAVQATTSVAATIAGASIFDAQASDLLASTTPFMSGATAPDPQANRSAVLLHVAHSGMQRVNGAALAQAGLDLGGVDPTRLHLRVGGSEVALELRGTDDGRFDAADELRFFATPGDRWNNETIYWLSVEATAGQRMRTRTASNQVTANLFITAIERGEWRGNQSYNPALAGPHGDHWFTGKLTAGPGTGAMALGMPITPTLPLAAGTTVLTVTGSAAIATDHVLAATFGGAIQQSVWSGWGDWARRFSFATSDVTSTITLLPGARPDRLDIDSVAWERPVALTFAGRGAQFHGNAMSGTYRLSGTPANATLYDVSDPVAPMILANATGSSLDFADDLPSRSYLLAGTGTLHAPTASAHQPMDLATAQHATVVYVAPALFHDALQPLVALRRTQGQRVAVVDTEAIYAGWSGGQIDPTAIRAFLRYAAATWQPAPAAVMLVGDGTSDPRNYTGRDSTTFVPPFLAPVDPYQGVSGLSLGETACETCFAQLDGDDPLSDPLPDLAIGRLPVKSADELAQLVAKITDYERGPAPGFWHSRAIFVSDNARDDQGILDPAGDFFRYAEQGIALQPSWLNIQRAFYDPNPATNTAPGHIADPVAASARTKLLLSSGAAFVTYTGHSNQWQWGTTDLSATPSTLLGLYDADDLSNGGQLPIILEMTCLTGAFQTPAFSGTTLDERLLLNPKGGAVAVWSSTGEGISHGHDLLQNGFFTEQWRRFGSPAPAALGALTQAGYVKLFTDGGCCQDAIRTFALFGDPLTVPQVRRGGEVLLPSVVR